MRIDFKRWKKAKQSNKYDLYYSNKQQIKMLVAIWTSLSLGNKFACQAFVNKESLINDVMDVK
jgi:uncharacterized ubiquitin-like protein YukD